MTQKLDKIFNENTMSPDISSTPEKERVNNSISDKRMVSKSHRAYASSMLV